MRLEIYRGFINPDECRQLNAWVYEAIENGWLALGGMVEAVNPIRISTRTTGHLFENSLLVKELLERIKSTVLFGDSKVMDHQGKEGIFVNYMPRGVGGGIYNHKDFDIGNNKSLLRCNIISSASEIGGVLHIEGKPVNLIAGDLHLYLATEHEHFINDVEGTTPRICWISGVWVNKEDWNSGLIKVGH